MCYSGSCPHELRSGECGKKKNQLCPESFESMEEYYEALEQRSSEEADFKYEQWKDRQLGI